MDFETDVLTKNGWKAIADITENDEIATLQDKKMKYQKPIKIHADMEYRGPMLHLRNHHIDIQVAMEHQMWVSVCHSKKKIWSPYKLVKAEQVIGQITRYKREHIWESDFDLDDTRSLFPDPSWEDGIPQWVWSLPSKYCQRLVDIMLLMPNAYRTEKEEPTAYYTESSVLANDFQRLCIHAEWMTMITQTPKGIWKMTVIKNRLNPTFNFGPRHKKLFQDEVVFAYEGPLYWIQVPAQAYLIRRKGKPVWTGSDTLSMRT